MSLFVLFVAFQIKEGQQKGGQRAELAQKVQEGTATAEEQESYARVRNRKLHQLEDLGFFKNIPLLLW